ncbi:MAG: 7TM-DISM domain-containing protein [Pseudobacteriovorax sp.]|nr:7TM-DISM domain-containing protein [Pseudobacteriovorax sp.]
MTVFLMSIFFNIILFIVFRSIQYLLYILYLGSISVLASSVWGYIAYDADLVQIISGAFMANFANLFSIVFLGFRRKKGWPFYFMMGTTIAWILIAFTIDDKTLTMKIVSILAAVQAAICYLSAIYLYFKERSFYVIIYLLAYGIFLFGSIIQTMIWRGVFPEIGRMDYLIFYAASIENILMLLAISYRIYEAETERRQNNKKLEYKMKEVENLVAEKTSSNEQLNKANGELERMILLKKRIRRPIVACLRIKCVLTFYLIH